MKKEEKNQDLAFYRQWRFLIKLNVNTLTWIHLQPFQKGHFITVFLLGYNQNWPFSVFRNNFFPRGENTWLRKKDDRKNYIELLSDPPLQNHTYPLSYVKHVNFLNFEEFDKKNPIYINMVRHPVERVISWYYYIRQNWYQIRYDKEKNTTSLKKDLSPTFFKVALTSSFIIT